MADNTQEFRATLSAAQVHILEMVARVEQIDHILRELCLKIEALLPNAVAGVTVLDRAARIFEFAVFPSLRPTYAAAMPGLRVIDRPGSCAVAIYKGEIITSADIANDTRFQKEWCTLNLDHGIRAIQSRPVFAPDGTSLGTFVLGFREPKSITAFDDEIVTAGARLAGLALTAYRSHQQQELLINELQHRTKNIFASVSALVYFTLKSNDDPKTTSATLEARIAALGHAHSLAVRDSGADLAELIQELLAPYGEKSRIELSGPAINLAPNAAMAFSLALHELATNAAKYGALSNRDGKVSIRWGVNRGRPVTNKRSPSRGGSTAARRSHGRARWASAARRSRKASLKLSTAMSRSISTRTGSSARSQRL